MPVHQRLAHSCVLELRRLCLVEVRAVEREAQLRVDDDIHIGVLEIRNLPGIDARENVNLAGLQLLNPRRCVWDDLEDPLIKYDLAIPVVVILHQRDMVTGDPLLELEWPGPDHARRVRAGRARVLLDS